MMKLHLGCGPHRFPGFENLDLELGHDLRLGLPGVADGSCELVYSSHLLEHLGYAEGARLLREVHRVLAPGGVVRLAVPDVRRFAEAYVRGDARFAERYLARFGDEERGHGDLAAEARALGALGPLYLVTQGFGHHALYDAQVLRRALAEAGFPEGSAVELGYNESRYLPRCALDIRFADHSLYMEAQKREH